MSENTIFVEKIIIRAALTLFKYFCFAKAI